MAMLAPVPRAIERIAIATKPGAFEKSRAACTRSCQRRSSHCMARILPHGDAGAVIFPRRPCRLLLLSRDRFDRSEAGWPVRGPAARQLGALAPQDRVRCYGGVLRAAARDVDSRGAGSAPRANRATRTPSSRWP